jgi:putative ABC transport system permease protein
MKQIAALTALTLRTLPQRFWMSLAAVVSIALVVGVLLAFLAMGAGFRKTMTGMGSDEVAILMRTGSTTELTSVITRDEVALLQEAPGGLARGADGRPLVSAELMVIVDALKRATQTEANISLRGVGAAALETRPTISIHEGRMFTPGTNEVIVGAAVLREFTGFELGRTVRLGTAEWVVVGVFEMGGSVFESEIWGDAPVIQNFFNRGTSYAIARVRLAAESAVDELRAYIASDPRLRLDVQTERDFYASQGGNIDFMVIMGWILGVVMAIGAFAGAWNTMYASVDARAREIATLRAIGFSGFAAFVAALVESLALAVIGGILGAVVSFVLFDGVSASTLGDGFTQVVFSFDLTLATVMTGIVLALVVGLLGGFFPALRAARTPLLAVHQA